MAEERTMHWPNGKVRETRRMLGGKKHGRRQGWYPTGQLQYDDNFDHGTEHGRQQAWYENGQPQYNDWYERGMEWDRAAARGSVEKQVDLLARVLLRVAASYV